MKIALVHSFYRAGPSGENTAVRMQANALADAGHEVKLISRSTDDFIRQPAYAIKSGLTVATGFGPSPLNEINDFNPDIVHAHNLFPNWGDRWLERLGHPLVATFHNFRPFCAAGTLNRNGSFCDLCATQGAVNAIKYGCYGGSQVRSIPLALATRKQTGSPLVERADRLIFMSPLARDTYAKYAGEQILSRSDIVPNFVTAPDHEKVTLAKHADSWIFVGRLSEEKGILPLLEHWPNNEALEILGDGPQRLEVERAIRNRANLRFSGRRDNSEVFEALLRSKGLIFPSVWLESAPSLVYLEALSIGIPVVALNGNAVAHDIRENGAGVVFDSLEQLPGALAKAKMLHDTIALAGKKHFTSHFSEKAWVKSITRTFGTAIFDFEKNTA